MRIYAGKPNGALYLIKKVWTRPTTKGEPMRQVRPEKAHAEITALYGLSCFGWFIGVQRFTNRHDWTTDTPERKKEAA
jgi:hypothetical protein